jgi:hypothetical protein
MERDNKGIVYWLNTFVISILSCFFLMIGISIILAAYELNNPFHFIITFFSASFMILISLVGIFWGLTRIYHHFVPLK